jgi:antitoxin component YwqK of YwqJK toxin-antitoxin module
MYLINRNSILALSTFIGLSIGLFAQNNQVDSKGRKQGEWVKFYDNSSAVRYQGQFKNDKPVGKFVYYYPSKTVRTIMIHDEGSNRTEAYYYHENNELIAYGIYRDQKKDSIWTHFLPTGHYSYEETYKNGELNGLRITYYGPEVTDTKTKIILRKANYLNGRLHGEYVEYFADGILKAKGQYVNGVPDGVIIKNHPNGKPMIKERWKNRTKHGWWTTYDEGGTEVGRRYYKNGVHLEGKGLDEYLEELKAKGINPNH